MICNRSFNPANNLIDPTQATKTTWSLRAVTAMLSIRSVILCRRSLIPELPAQLRDCSSIFVRRSTRTSTEEVGGSSVTVVSIDWNPLRHPKRDARRPRRVVRLRILRLQLLRQRLCPLRPRPRAFFVSSCTVYIVTTTPCR